MTRHTLRSLLPAVVALPLIAAFGGWAVTTLEDLPDYAVAREPLPLTFTVRHHGEEVQAGLKASVSARRAGGAELRAAAQPTRAAGQYRATLTLPEPGEWMVTIHNGFGDQRVTLLPLTVVAPGAPAPAPLADGERGRRLFVAKGCLTCHLHRDVAGSGKSNVGPDLTAARFAPEYLKQFLADPSIKPPSEDRTVRMPNLGLKPAEIAALAAFLNGERQASR